jgi:hypothetical protein
VVLVLLEEDQVTDAGARAGDAALVDYLRKQINGIIPTLYLGKQDINERFQKVAQNGVVLEDWRVTGETQGARPDPQNYTHARRSEDVGSPPAASAPTTCLHPAQGVQSIVYRDTKGHLHELWRDASDRSARPT